MTFGPYIGNMLQHADKMSLIRGMSVDALGHSAGAARFFTGKPPSGNNARGSSVATVISDLYGSERLLSNLCLQTASYNVDRSPEATGTKIWTMQDLFDFVESTDAPFDNDVLSQVEHFLQNNTDVSQSDYLAKALDYKIKMRDMTALHLIDDFDLGGSSSEMAIVRDAFALSLETVNENGFENPNCKLAIAAQAIISGASRCVTVEVVNGLDTHYDWASSQGPNQEEGFNAIAKLISYLESTPHSNGGSYLDHTTIFCFSEMGRTPMLIGDGRNHNRTTSCFLVGAGIQKGVIIGGTSDIGAGCQRVDLATGAISSTGEIIRPDHIHRALLQSIGVTDDVADLRVPPLSAILS
jgi:hypothetical protein